MPPEPWWSVPKRPRAGRLPRAPPVTRRIPTLEDLGSAAETARLRLHGVPTNFEERHEAALRAADQAARRAGAGVGHAEGARDPLVSEEPDPLISTLPDPFLAALNEPDPLLQGLPRE